MKLPNALRTSKKRRGSKKPNALRASKKRRGSKLPRKRLLQTRTHLHPHSLRENGYDQSIADAAEKEYKEEKDAMIKELTNVTYSQVTGKGEGAKWLQEHADMGQ